MKFPKFYENSRVPVVLSYFSPINIGAITIGPLVFSRGEMSDVTKNHETIHWQQYKETLIIGFLLLYLSFWAWGLLRYRDGKVAYAMIPFEREAYGNDEDFEYLKKRKHYAWLDYIWKGIDEDTKESQ